MKTLLDTEIKFLKGVGPLRAKRLGEDLGIFTLRDMLYNFPYKYIDRSVIHKIGQLVEGMPYVLLKGQIVSKNIEGSGRHERLHAIFADGSGYIELVWFNSIKNIERSLQFNHPYLLLGKPTSFNGRLNIAHPELEEINLDANQSLKMQPYYHTSDKMKKQGLTSKMIEDLVVRVFDLLGNERIKEVLPDYLLQHYNLTQLDDALRIIHHPQTATSLPAASHRLKFEELFFLQLEILRSNQNRRSQQIGFIFGKVGKHFMDFYHHHLPFTLTEAQKRVIREIRKDVSTGKQMNRLLQGDVGSGKTMVALLCLILAIDNKFQGCLMAPTEILAEQHFQSLSEYLSGMPIRVELLTGNIKGRQRKKVLEGVADGSVDILVGTHSLIEPTVSFLNLGLVVIDEQHRFGVKQRASLWKKNIRPPHILVMTATPIPRTLAMTVYGDLDVSVIDELPPGRKPIKTLHLSQQERSHLYAGMRRQLQEKRQIYVVYPLIKENEKQNLRDLETGYNQMVELFRDYKVGIVHGKMKPIDKENTMQAFKNGQIQILVSTTVIEVGVNVPNATVMVIENAERFGLAQLHQLRGRVGRGAEQSYCILLTQNKLNETSQRRMQVMVDSTDGFVIAEEDMKLRGPGDLEGTAQSGMPFDLKIANIIKDQELLVKAREAAADVLAKDPQQTLPQHEMLWSHLRMLRKTKVNYSAIS